MSKTHTIASKSTTSVKKTSKKRAKDPNAPKRFRTAYILFCVEKRNEVKNDNPGLSSQEILGELGAQWKAADAATKQRFQKLSDAEKVEYEEKMAAYKSEQGDKESAAKENHKKKKSSEKDEVINNNGSDDFMED